MGTSSLVLACTGLNARLGFEAGVAEAHALAELGAGPLRQSELVARLGLTKSTVSRLASALVDRGWVERDVADHPTDSEQVALIRIHLRDEAERFGVGDFGDPATIHGQEMPGLAVLEANFDALETGDARTERNGYRSQPTIGAAGGSRSFPSCSLRYIVSVSIRTVLGRRSCIVQRILIDGEVAYAENLD